MKLKRLNPNHLIGMIDYPPLHSPESFKKYYIKLKSGQKIEPAIVVPAQAVIEHFKKRKIRYKKYKEQLGTFLVTHPKALYFMSGGKHRSAAATVLGIKVPCLVVKNDADVAYVLNLMEKGKITGVPSVEKNFEKTLRMLEEHFYENQQFWTMDEKTRAMIKNGDIPKKLIKTKV